MNATRSRDYCKGRRAARVDPIGLEMDMGCDWLFYRRCFLWGIICTPSTQGRLSLRLCVLASSFFTVFVFRFFFLSLSSPSPSLPYTILHSSLLLHQPFPSFTYPKHILARLIPHIPKCPTRCSRTPLSPSRETLPPSSGQQQW